jgi:outer membrane protein assembly factor BamB
VSGEVLAPPVVGGNTVIVRSVDGHLRALSAVDGGELWDVEQQVPRLTLRGNGTPAIVEDVVIAGFDNGRLAAYDLNDGDTRWENVVAPSRGRTELERLADVDSSILVVGPDLYTASYSGRVASLAVESGRILWSQDLSSYLAIGADWTNIYVTDKNAEVIAVNRSSGAIQWSQASMRMRGLTAPIPFAATIVVGDFEGYLHWLDARSGQLVARSQTGKSAIVGTPVVAGDAIIVQTDNGHLVAYRLKEPTG